MKQVGSNVTGVVLDQLYITGRSKDLIIIRGLNHYPQDIEYTVERSDPLIRPGCCAAFPIEIDGKEQKLLRTSIKSLTGTNRSLMPDGLEAALSDQDLADVIRFVQEAPGAR